MSAVTPPKAPCWVSSACFPPPALRAWVPPQLAALPNLRVLYRTVVSGALRSSSDGRVTALKLVTRSWKGDPQLEWGRLSEHLGDWYSPAESANFSKVLRTVAAAVVVEATELGDVLLSASLPHTQGVEVPLESSLTSDDGLTQSTVFTFFMQLNNAAAAATVPAGDAWVRSGAKPYWGALPEGACCCGGGNDLPDNNNTCKAMQGHPLNGTCTWPKQCSWGGVWRYRRTIAAPKADASPVAGVGYGDVSLQNWGHGNDMMAACLFLPTAAAEASVTSGSWAGGVNITALRMAEDRAFGWFHSLSTAAARRGGDPALAQHFSLNKTLSGSFSGLVKFPYLRDTRRAVGLGGFRLNHTDMQAAGSRKTGVVFTDAVGLGSYNFDVKPGNGYGAANGGPRRLPSYMWNFSSNTGLAGHAAPFYFPLRALTVQRAPNVLSAGKTIAMTFAANTAAREHLDEWSCGVGAGAAAALMALHNVTSAELLLTMVPQLQALLKSDKIAQPLSWSKGPSPRPSPPSPPTPGRRCHPDCHPPLAKSQWLLLKGHWHVAADRLSATVTASSTVIKKSERPGAALPPAQRKEEARGATVHFAARGVASADDQYWLATIKDRSPSLGFDSLLGLWTDDYGGADNITKSVWSQGATNNYNIQHVDNNRSFLVAQNAAGNRYRPLKWSRYDWVVNASIPAPFVFGFCVAAWSASTKQEAMAANGTDRADLYHGCGGFPFTIMQRKKLKTEDETWYTCAGTAKHPCIGNASGTFRVSVAFNAKGNVTNATLISEAGGGCTFRPFSALPLVYTQRKEVPLFHLNCADGRPCFRFNTGKGQRYDLR